MNEHWNSPQDWDSYFSWAISQVLAIKPNLSGSEKAIIRAILSKIQFLAMEAKRGRNRKHIIKDGRIYVSPSDILKLVKVSDAFTKLKEKSKKKIFHNALALLVAAGVVLKVMGPAYRGKIHLTFYALKEEPPLPPMFDILEGDFVGRVEAEYADKNLQSMKEELLALTEFIRRVDEPVLKKYNVVYALFLFQFLFNACRHYDLFKFRFRDPIVEHRIFVETHTLDGLLERVWSSLIELFSFEDNTSDSKEWLRNWLKSVLRDIKDALGILRGLAFDIERYRVGTL
jgi:hypothetical protein